MKITEYVFKKQNSEIRVLKGTTDIEKFSVKNPKIWENIQPKMKKDKNEVKNKNILTLIDVENNEWRSIRKDSIISQRKVKQFRPKYNFSDNDGYIGRSWDLKSYNCIKRNKIPYHTLMVIGSNIGLNREEIENEVEYIIDLSLNKINYTVRGTKIRAISRAVRLFLNNNFIKASKDGLFTITNKGKNLLEFGVA